MEFSSYDHGYDMYAEFKLFTDDLRITVSRRIEIDDSWGFENWESTIANWKDWTQETELLFLSGADLKSFVVKLVTEMCSCGFEIWTEDSSEDALDFALEKCEEFLAPVSDEQTCEGDRLTDGGMSQIKELASGEKWVSLTEPWRTW